MNRPNSYTRTQRYLPYLVSGLLLGLSYPSYPYVRLEFLAWVWMAPLLLALKSVVSFRSFVGRVYLTTLVVCCFGESWLLVAYTWGAILLFFVSALIFTVPFIGFYFIRQTLGWRTALLSAPVVWTAWDWVYHQTDGSFGWLMLGVTQSNLYWLVQYVDITGVWGITFWLVLFNVLVVMALEERGARSEERRLIGVALFAPRSSLLAPRLLRRLAVICVVMLGVPLSYSAYVFLKAKRAETSEISLLLVQPNADPWQKMQPNVRAASLGQTVRLTQAALAEHKPDLIIWPETAVPYVLPQDQVVQDILYSKIAKWETPLLTGILDQRADLESAERPARLQSASTQAALYNAAVLLTPAARAAQAAGLQTAAQPAAVTSSAIYHKQVLMPFVERVPWREQLPALSHLAMNWAASGNLGAGSEATVFSWRNRQGELITVAAPICYEQQYPATLAEFVRRGAQMLAVITNEGYFSQSHGAYQLAAFTRLRAIELRRAIARSANNGVTCLIDPLGRITAQAPWWVATTLTGRLQLSQELSLYVRYTDCLPRLCVWLSLLLMAAAIIIQFNQRLWARRQSYALLRWAWQRRSAALNQSMRDEQSAPDH